MWTLEIARKTIEILSRLYRVGRLLFFPYGWSWKRQKESLFVRGEASASLQIRVHSILLDETVHFQFLFGIRD